MSENPTFNQVNEQESSAYRKGLKGRDAMPSVLIGRSDGRVTVGDLDKLTGNVYFEENGENWMHPNVPLEKLADTYQEKLAAELAGAALRGAEAGVTPNTGGQERSGSEAIAMQIAEVESAMDNLINSLPVSEKVPAWQFATALHGYETDNAKGKLSPDGLALAERYRALYHQLKNLREQQPKV